MGLGKQEILLHPTEEEREEETIQNPFSQDDFSATPSGLIGEAINYSAYWRGQLVKEQKQEEKSMGYLGL